MSYTRNLLQDRAKKNNWGLSFMIDILCYYIDNQLKPDKFKRYLDEVENGKFFT